MDLLNDTRDKKTNCECNDKVQQSEKGPPSERSKCLIPAVPPVLKNVGKLAAGVAGMSSGSATEKEVEYRKCKMQETIPIKQKCPGQFSTCLEYGTSQKNEKAYRLQPKETFVVTPKLVAEEESSCYDNNCKELHRKENVTYQKVKFQEPTNIKHDPVGNDTKCNPQLNKVTNDRCTIDKSPYSYNLCHEDLSEYKQKCSAMESKIQIKSKTMTTYDCAYKEQYLKNVSKNYKTVPNQCPKNITYNKMDYRKVISKEDEVYSCKCHKDFDLFEKKYKDMSGDESKYLNKQESISGSHSPKNVIFSKKIDLIEISNSLNEQTSSSSNDGNLVYNEFYKLDMTTSETQSTKRASEPISLFVERTSNALLFSNNVDLFVTNKLHERINLNENLVYNDLYKIQMDATKNTELINNINLFSENMEKNTFITTQVPVNPIDFHENLISNDLHKILVETPRTYSNKNTREYEGNTSVIHSTKSAPQYTNNIDLFVKNKELEQSTKEEHIKTIDLFEENAKKPGSNWWDGIDLIYNKSKELTDSGPASLIDLFNKRSDIYNVQTRKDMVNKNSEDFSVDVTSGSENSLILPNLPTIDTVLKYDRFVIKKRWIGVKNCKCNVMGQKDVNGLLLHNKTCKMYTTVLGLNACKKGNPRNKTALQPGHSLMDWIRLSHAGQDLTGVGPRAGTLSVSPKQLAEHNTENDAWIAIRGKVYNVTAYFDFHPGGKEELMKGVGQDATQMFNAVHPWVNYESILQKCLVGRLTSTDVDSDTYSLFYDVPSNKTIKAPSNCRIITNMPLPNLNGGIPSEKMVCPKFDWVQQLDYITTIFYTKPFSNPEVQVTAPTKENKLDIILTYNNQIFKNHLHFSNNIHWPCKVIVNWDTGKIEISFRKIASKIWDNYGSLTQESERVTEDYEFEKIKYIVLNNVKENYNTHMIAFQRIDGVKQIIPIGYHIKVYGTIGDQELIRCYTPVPCNFMRKYSQDYEAYRGDVCLLIKSYAEGLLSPTICNSIKGEVFELSLPLGKFNMEKIASRPGYLILAGGTGITPMLGIIKFILQSTQMRCEKLSLLYFNRTEDDIILRKHFDTLSESDERIVVKYVLSQPPENWKGLTGHIDAKLLKTTIDDQCTNTKLFPVDIFSLICGPLVFTNLAKSLLSDIGYTDNNIHVFGA